MHIPKQDLNIHIQMDVHDTYQDPYASTSTLVLNKCLSSYSYTDRQSNMTSKFTRRSKLTYPIILSIRRELLFSEFTDLLLLCYENCEPIVIFGEREIRVFNSWRSSRCKHCSNVNIKQLNQTLDTRLF